MDGISIWQLLGFVAAINAFMMGSFFLGGYLVYRTKREDGRIFNMNTGDEGTAFNMDEGFDELEPGEVAEETSERAKKFIQQFGESLTPK